MNTTNAELTFDCKIRLTTENIHNLTVSINNGKHIKIMLKWLSVSTGFFCVLCFPCP